MGDGDCVAIGGNHLIHAARRNIDLTALVFNNSIYGMTGGQMSPTTFEGDRSTTSVYGNIEQAFDICELARAAGRHLRGARHPLRLRSSSSSSSPAASPTRASRSSRRWSPAPPTTAARTGIADPAEMLQRQQERAVPVEKFDREGPRLHDRYPVGVLHHAEREEYTAAYADVMQRAQEAPVAEHAARGRRGRHEIRLSGSGGQGIMLAATLLADAAVATGTRGRRDAELRPRGPRRRLQGRGHRRRRRDRLSRGHAPASPSVSRRRPSTRYAAQTRPGGLVVYDERLVQADAAARASRLVGPAVHAAGRAELGKAVAANIVAARRPAGAHAA